MVQSPGLQVALLTGERVLSVWLTAGAIGPNVLIKHRKVARSSGCGEFHDSSVRVGVDLCDVDAAADSLCGLDLKRGDALNTMRLKIDFKIRHISPQLTSWKLHNKPRIA